MECSICLGLHNYDRQLTRSVDAASLVFVFAQQRFVQIESSHHLTRRHLHFTNTVTLLCSSSSTEAFVSCWPATEIALSDVAYARNPNETYTFKLSVVYMCYKTTSIIFFICLKLFFPVSDT